MHYTTHFPDDENPISVGGVWSHLGQDWATVQTANGIAFGTQTGRDGYNDSYALLTGFPPDQTASAVVQRAPDMDTSCSREVLLLLRWADSEHSAIGYECLFACHGAIQIVRWNGHYGDFTPLENHRGSPPIQDGDRLHASIVGNEIAVSVNQVEKIRFQDDSYATGNPGIGMFRRDCGENDEFGFSRFSASSI